MSKPYDDALKQLVEANPQAFVDLLGLDAQVVKAHPSELHEAQLALDQLLEVRQKQGKSFLVNFEFQTQNDYEMGERLLRYNILARHQYHLDVASCVLYLYHDGNIPTSPLYLHAGNGEVIRFQYHTLELSKMTTQELIALHHQELLPLLPFTQGGRASGDRVDDNRAASTGRESTSNRRLYYCNVSIET